jgi:hypothetical protein
LFSANALTTTNLFANTLTLANAAASITGNLYVSNAVTTTNAYLSGTLNVQGTSNLATINAAVYFGDGGLLSNIPTFTQPLANLVVSNAVTTSNAYLSGTLNVQGTSNLSVANIANIYTTNIIGFIGSQWTSGTGNVYYLENVGIGTSIVSANLTVLGNIYASNAVSAPSAYFTSAYVTDSMVASTFYGTLAGANTGAFSNIYSANAVTTTNLYTAGISSNATDTTFNYDTITVPYIYVAAINASSTGNFYSMSTPTNLAVGNSISANTLTLSNATASITGNLFVSNALTTTNLFANTLTLANAAARITGNLFVSNALTTTNLFANTLTLANAAARITGNLFVSNALTTTNLFANTGTFSNNLYAAIASVGLNPSLATETFTVAGNTSFIGNVTVTSDASGNAYVLADRVPTGSLHVSSYVTGSVPLTTTTNLIQKYLSNAATIGSNVVSGTSYNVVTLPGTANSGVNFPNQGTSPGRADLSVAAFYVEAWINLRAVGTSQVIVERSSGTTYDWSLYINTGNILVFGVYNSGGAVQASNATAFTTSTGWTHVAGSYIPATTTTGTVRCYVNGGLGTTTGSLATTAPRLTAGANVYIGTDSPNSTFTGNIADVRIFYGGTVPSGALISGVPTLASPAIPFSITQPSYVTGNSNCHLALQTSYFPGASTSPYGPCLTLPGTVGSYYLQTGSPLGQNWKTYGFTLEAWINYPTFASSNTYATGPQPFTIMQAAGGAFSDWSFGATTTGQLAFWFNGGGTFYAIASPVSSLVTGQWAHICVQTTSAALALFINGTIQTLTQYNVTGGTSTASAYPAGFAPQLAAAGISLNNGYYGYYAAFAIAKARMVYGTASQVGNVYSMSGFTPSPNLGPVPAGATIAWSLDSQYPLPTYPSIQDVTPLALQSGSYGAVPTPIGGVTSNTLSPYSTTYPQLDSIRFDGTGYIDYGNAASSALCSNLWASPWTIEGWVYFNNFSAGNQLNCIISRVGASTYDWALYVNQVGVLSWRYGNSVGGDTQVNGPALSTGTWYHVAATYDGARCNVYTSYNASSVGTASVSAAGMGYLPTSSIQIGAISWLNTGTTINGNLADVRVSNVARYTGSTYTVPSAPFVADSSTLLLLRSLAGQVGTTLQVQGRGLNAVSLGATRSVQSYPPAPMSSYLLDTTSNASVTYGQGKYVASASSEYTGQPAWLAFDGNGATAWGSNLGYASGVYTGSVVTVDNLGNACAGEWIQFQMPVSVILSTYSLVNINNTYQPTLSWLLGSRDGINWTLVFKYAGSPSGASSTYTVSATQGYNYYRLVVGSVVSANATNMYSYVLNGTEESLCVTSDSKVGVGIANPQRSLEVAGDLVVSGTVSCGNPVSFRNRIINGDMRIAQRGTSATMSTSVLYQTIDRWGSYVSASGGTITVAQRLLTASDTPWQVGFSNSYTVTVVSGATTNLDNIPGYQYIEGFNISDLKWGSSFGQPVTLSFWYRSNLPSGSVLSVPFKNSGGTSSYISTVTTIGANTWQYATATIPPPPNGTTWLTTNGVGISMSLFYFNNIGTTFTGAPNTWLSGNYVTAAGAYNWVQSAGNYIEFTGVQLERGTVATGFEFRNYAQELALCQRYYVQYGPKPYMVLGFGAVESTPTAYITLPLPVPMRVSSNVSPTLTINNPSSTLRLNAGSTTYTPTAYFKGDATIDNALIIYINAFSGGNPPNGAACKLFDNQGAGGTGAVTVQISAEL